VTQPDSDGFTPPRLTAVPNAVLGPVLSPMGGVRPEKSLPAPATPLFGRADDVANGVAMLSAGGARLFTLIGPGGVGKTRLALAIAEELAPRFDDGVVLVDLAVVSDPDLVLPAVAHAVRVDAADLTSLTLPLQGRRLLLVLDNLEHVLDAAEAVGALVAACPDLVVLTTSRVRLNVRGEQLPPVAPLRAPTGADRSAVSGASGLSEPADLETVPAVALFLDAARRVDPGFRLGRDNAAAVAAICTRLDGLPLALELAAARLGVLRPADLLRRLSEALPLLGGGPLDAPQRQRTIYDEIDWSYRLLRPSGQRLFRSLCVFVNGFTIEAAEAVVGDDRSALLDGLGALVDASLVYRHDAADGTARFRMLTTMHQFGRDRLAENDEVEDVRRRHAEWCVALAESVRAAYFTPDEPKAMDRLEADRLNLTAALEWSLASATAGAATPGADRLDIGLRIGGAMAWFWHTRGPVFEGDLWLARLLAPGVGAPALRGDVLTGAALQAWTVGDMDAAARLGAEAVEVWRRLGDGEQLARTLGYVATTASTRGDTRLELDASEEAVRISRSTQSPVWLALSLFCLGRALSRQGRNDEAADAYRENLAVLDAIPYARAASWTLAGLADLLMTRGRPEDRDEARAHYRRSITLAWQVGSLTTVAAGLPQLATALVVDHQLELAAYLVGASAALRASIGMTTDIPSGNADVTIEQQLKDGLGRARYVAAWTAGHTRPIADTISDGLGSPTSAQHHLGSPLTRREHEVLRLVARGMTDPPIAQELYLSVRTVENHVSHILTKLDASNRTAATTRAISAGLLGPPDQRE